MHSNKSTDFIHGLAHGVVKRRENDTASFLRAGSLVLEPIFTWVLFMSLLLRLYAIWGDWCGLGGPLRALVHVSGVCRFRMALVTDVRVPG